MNKLNHLKKRIAVLGKEKAELKRQLEAWHLGDLHVRHVKKSPSELAAMKKEGKNVMEIIIKGEGEDIVNLLRWIRDRQDCKGDDFFCVNQDLKRHGFPLLPCKEANVMLMHIDE